MQDLGVKAPTASKFPYSGVTNIVKSNPTIALAIIVILIVIVVYQYIKYGRADKNGAGPHVKKFEAASKDRKFKKKEPVKAAEADSDSSSDEEADKLINEINQQGKKKK